MGGILKQFTQERERVPMWAVFPPPPEAPFWRGLGKAARRGGGEKQDKVHATRESNYNPVQYDLEYIGQVLVLFLATFP